MTVTTLQQAPADFWDKWDSARMTEGTPRRAEADAVPRHEAPPRRQRSAGRRASRGFLRFMPTLGIGVGGTLAWQAYGDEVRDLLATAYPQQLGWIAPQPDATASAMQTTGVAPAPAPTVDQQQLNALALNIAAVRQSVEQLTTQVATSQQQMSGEIIRLQASEQDILTKIATPPPRPAPPTRKLAPPLATAAPAPTAPAAAAH